MGANTAENTNLRLKAVLDILAENVWSEEKLNAGEVLAEATARVPFNAHEAELLSGGIPRGHKTLTSASAKLVKAVQPFDAEVRVGRDGQSVDARSIMGLLMLGAGQGSTLELTAEGPDAEAALDAVVALVEARFDEEA